jgi:polysaccharide biosynthesis transport protein
MTFIDFEYILSRRTNWSVAALCGLLVLVSYVQWQSRTAPLYAAVTTVQFENSATPSAGNAHTDAAPTAEIKNFRQIMVSNRMRSEVAASLTPAERKVVLRPALRRYVRGQPVPTVASALGSIDPEPVGNSSLIRVKVTHEDPEAAALIANRYVEEIQTFFTRNPEAIGSPASEVDAVPFHRLDVATPNYAGRTPYLLRMRRSTLGLALFAWGLTAAMFSLVRALRTAGEMRSI